MKLARRIIAAHVAASAALTIVVLSFDVVNGDVSKMRALLLALGSASVGVFLGVRTARRIAEPVAELAAHLGARAAHFDGTGHGDRTPSPEVLDRDDEIGDLSRSLQHLLSAVSGRVSENEDFAADIVHEIRNPLASLHSASQALRHVGEGQRLKLIDIIETDVGRLERIVAEISSASRLDADLVREVAVRFDLSVMIGDLVDHLSARAHEKHIDLICDLPDEPVHITGLEGRLAQVFVNVLDNALSFCDPGDAIRVWLRQKGERVLLVVEDTGPGIPDDAAEKIFRRFYSHRPPEQFGANSGLGLAISRQIVEAHAGAIWAENIRPTERDLLSEPLGARFVVVLPR